MFERYSEKARRVIFFSRFEASRFGSPAIDTEHLLLGILREAPDLVTSVAGPDAIQKIRKRIREQCPIRDSISKDVELPFSEAASKVLMSMAEQADQSGARIITAENILTALLKGEDCLAKRILVELGVTAETVGRESTIRQGEATSDILGSRAKGNPVPNRDCRNIVNHAIDEARLSRSTSVRPEHLLLALLRHSSLAAGILREAGLDYDGVRRRLKSKGEQE